VKIGKVQLKFTLMKWAQEDNPEEFVRQFPPAFQGSFKLDDTMMSRFDINYLRYLQQYGYAVQKQYFEAFFTRVTNRGKYLLVEGNKTYIFGKSDMLTRLNEVNTQLTQIRGPGQPPKFFNVWFADPNKQVIVDYDWVPCNPEVAPCSLGPGIFNIFAGFNPAIGTKYDVARHDELLSNFKALGTALCGGNAEHFQFFYSFFAHLVKIPQEKAPIAFVLKGKQGCGKNLFLKIMANLIGTEHFVSSARAADFIGNHNAIVAGKLLVNFDEFEMSNRRDEAVLKAFITSDSIVINKKHQNMIAMPNYCRVVITTNKTGPVPIDFESGDRRYVVFDATEQFLNPAVCDRAFWDAFYAHHMSPEFVAALYADLMRIDVGAVDWLNRPITDAYKLMSTQMRPINAFIEYYIGTFSTDDDGFYWDEPQHPSRKVIFDTFSRWCNTYGYNCSTADVMLEDLRNYGGFNIQTTSNNTEIHFTPSDVCSIIKQKKEAEK
jgi:hypothetical protein